MRQDCTVQLLLLCAAQGYLAKEMRGHEALSSRGLFLLMPQGLSVRWWSPALGEEPVE